MPLHSILIMFILARQIFNIVDGTYWEVILNNAVTVSVAFGKIIDLKIEFLPNKLVVNLKY